MKSKLVTFFLGAAALVTPLHASIVLVDFGATDSNLAKYNEITSLAAMSSPLALKTTTGTGSGMSLSFSGGVAASSTVSSTRDGGASAAWSTISGGEDIANVASQGLGFKRGESVAVFTLSGMIIGQEYEMMLLSGSNSTGGNSTLSLVGLDAGYSFTKYDAANTSGENYNAGTKTLAFGNYAPSGRPASLDLAFTAAAEDFEIRIAIPPFQQGIQGLAISTIPEPSTSLLGAFGILAALGIRRRHN